MFYYKITVQKRTATMTSHREFLRTSDLGDYIAALATERPGKITVEPTSQRDYIAATRPGE